MWVVVCLWSVISFARTKVTRFLQLSIKSTLSLNTVYGKYCTHRNPRIYNIYCVSRGNGKSMVLYTLTYSIFQFVVSQFTLCIYQSCANLEVSREYCKRYSSIYVKDNEMRKCWRKSEFWGICSGYTCKRCLITLWTVWQIFRELVWLINIRADDPVIWCEYCAGVQEQ